MRLGESLSSGDLAPPWGTQALTASKGLGAGERVEVRRYTWAEMEAETAYAP